MGDDEAKPLGGAQDVSVSTGVQVLISPDEFAEDLDLKLGRANGNIYHRKEGVEGVHDGQVMVRLKKKRFVILDYGIVPNEADIQAAAIHPHISVLDGAGIQKCTSADCTKVGVPVMLYDSAPEEPASLYLRSGLCFTCQRNLNEKRRTQRKRKSDINAEMGSPQSTYTVPSGQKKLKINGETLDLSHDTIIIQGPVEGTKPHGDGYGYPEIGPDLQAVIREANAATDSLLTAVSSPSSGDAAAFAAAVAAGESGGAPQDSEDPAVSAANAAVAAAAAAAGESTQSVTNVEVATLYEKAWSSMTKGIFLLSQWKASWDSHFVHDDAGLADAVASAASIVAAAAEGHEDTNMIPLLLAAESKEAKKEAAGEVFSV